MDTPRNIIDYIGREDCAARLGVTMARIERATRGDKLPASWLDTLESLAGRPLPREVFSFKRAQIGGDA